ncbi:MAG: FliH/SctL family protein [Deltaproteobacteria bacterium]|nr:FliH/SctL family protein [Deltaproteobacteria bacterium]
MGEPDFSCLLRLEGPIVPAHLLAARDRAAELLEEAQQEADRIRATARDELEALRAEERRRLRRDAGRWLARRRERLARADHLRRIRLCQAAAEACLAVAEQVWREIPAERGPLLRALAREVHRRAPPGAEIQLRVHPADRAALEGEGEVRVDASLAPGDLVARLPGGGLDARVETRAGLALDALAGALGLIREEPA